MTLQWALLFLLSTGYASAYSSGYCTDNSLYTQCINSLYDDFKSGATICSAVNTYGYCIANSCNLGTDWAQTFYNSFKSVIQDYGYNCNTRWIDISGDQQKNSLFASFGVTPGNNVNGLRSQSFVTIALVSLGTLALKLIK
ncbi:hypothetical protein BgiBS90_027498 [Biomphalaria glabrata]|nr:hypothetical protein BgiBS90_027498 [Biomphalaria glabrata]